MSQSFSRWDAARAQADSADALRALLGEVARWRATNLTDVVGQRDATWAIARIHQALGDTASALREARSLVSLCRTPPAAESSDEAAAEDLVAELGGGPPKRRNKKKPARKSPPDGGRGKAPRKERTGSRGGERSLSLVQQAIVQGHTGDYGEAFKTLRGKGGPTAQLVRTWLDLKQALAGPDDQRAAALAALLERLQGALPEVPVEAVPAAVAAEVLDETRLAKIMGRNLPPRRAKALRAIQAWIDAHPDHADQVAEAVLLDHLDSQGDAPAPWYAGFVAQAFVDGGARTRKALQAMREAGSVAPAIYEEPQFSLLLDLWRQARAQGLTFVDLRRGVLRKEPEDRRLWTLRMRKGGAEGVITAARDTEDPLDDELATELAKRVRRLSDVMVLVAPGAGNAALRAGAGVLDVKVVESGSALQTLVQHLSEGPSSSGAERQSQAPAAKEEPRPKSPPKPRAPSHAERVQAVQAALGADEVPSPDILVPLVGPIKRVRDVMNLAEALDGPDAAARLRALVVALHRTVPERVRLLQATTLILRQAAAGDASILELLTSAETAERLGGTGIDSVIQVAGAVQAAGWQLDRVLRGVTRRERRERPALDVLADHLEPLWRLVVQQGDVRGEVWVAEALPPEGRAGLAQLTLRDAPRVAVVGESLAKDWQSLGGPPLVAVDGLAQTLATWTTD